MLNHAGCNMKICNTKFSLSLFSNFVRESNAMISYRSARRPVTAVPDVERLVERLQHGLQYDRHAGARLQED